MHHTPCTAGEGASARKCAEAAPRTRKAVLERIRFAHSTDSKSDFGGCGQEHAFGAVGFHVGPVRGEVGPANPSTREPHNRRPGIVPAGTADGMPSSDAGMVGSGLRPDRRAKGGRGANGVAEGPEFGNRPSYVRRTARSAVPTVRAALVRSAADAFGPEPVHDPHLRPPPHASADSARPSFLCVRPEASGSPLQLCDGLACDGWCFA